MAPLSSVELSTKFVILLQLLFPYLAGYLPAEACNKLEDFNVVGPKWVMFRFPLLSLVNAIPITTFPLTILSRTSMSGLLRFTRQPNQSFIPPPNLAAASGDEKLCLLPVRVHVTRNCGSRLEAKDLSLDEFWVNCKRRHGLI